MTLPGQGDGYFTKGMGSVPGQGEVPPASWPTEGERSGTAGTHNLETGMLGVGWEYLRTEIQLPFEESPRTRPFTLRQSSALTHNRGLKEVAFGLPSLLGSPGLLLSLSQFPTAQEGTRPGLPSNHRAGLHPPLPCEGKSELPRERTWWEGWKLQPSRDPWGVRGKSPQEEGEALTDTRFPRSVPALSGQRDGKGVPEAAATPGAVPPQAVLQARSLVLSGPRGVRRATAQGCFSRARPSPRPQRVRAEEGVLRAGRARTRHPERRAGRIPKAQPAPPPPPPARQGPRLTGLAEAGSRRRRRARGSAGPGPPVGGSSTPPPSRPAPLPPLPHTFHRK